MTLSVVFFLPLILTAFGESIPDYNNPYSPIFTDKPVYTWTDKIKMTIISPSWNTDRHLVDSIGGDDDHPIKISTRENSLEPYRFTETDVNSGVFTAEIILTGFSHDADGDGDIDTSPRTFGSGPTSGFLEIDRDSAVTISFEFADGVVLTESVPISWNVGTIQFSKEYFLSDDSIVVHVVDLDMNLNPEALDHLTVHIFSESDVSGIEINAVESSESSGLFTAVVTLSQTSPSSGNRLYSLPGDKIIANYDDHTLPKPYSISDSLTIETSARVDSSIPSIERIQSISPIFSDSFGNPLESITAENSVQIVGNIVNEQNFKQKFVYLFQVKNKNHSIESLSWIQGEISPSQSLDVSQSWIPKTSGEYIIETFVWDSLNDLVPLSPFTSNKVVVE